MAAKNTRSIIKKTTKKSTKKIAKSVKVTTVKKQKTIYSKVFENLRFGESYTSLVLGIIAVIVATILLISFFSNRQNAKPKEDIAPATTDTDSVNTPSLKPKIGEIYTVTEGDTLWSISEKVYGSGYNWVDIAKENNLTNTGLIFAGNKLKLPQVELKDPTVVTGEDEAVVSRTMRIADETYTVVKGDDLWNIAVRSYGDGYKWIEIAKANNLSNPNFIHPGNVLKIPRN